PKWLYTISPSFELSDKMDAFIEVYGFFGKSDPQHSLDAGFSYLLSDNMQLDLAAGFGLSKSAGDSFITMGFSFRLN
ncbi:MAG: transporter, partial [Flavisolibacter sp.]